jgi:drug/metabolite transporter superfamily protein YnfA
MELALSLMVLAAIALVIGAFVLWRKGGSNKQIGLMLLLALIMAANVAIWTLPDSSGEAPLGQELR